MRQLTTPHVPHNWESQVFFEETTGTLLAGDVGSQLGDGPALTTDDIVEAADAAEDLFQSSSINAATAPTIRRMAALEPTTVAIMHGSSYSGDGGALLRSIADSYERRLQQAMANA